MVEKAFRIGYAFDPKKVDSFMQPSLFNLAKEQGIDLVPIDFEMPLIDQGPFDCVVHKSYDSSWTDQLLEMRSRCPKLVIIDEPVAIQQLRNRKTMLQVIDEMKITSQVSVKSPYQIFIESPEGLSDYQSKSIQFPVIAKPLMVTGSLGSHQMYLVFEQEGLDDLKLEPPFLLQEFVNHGGVVFKVYVAGRHARCVKRKSLPDICETKVAAAGDKVLPFSLISDVTTQDQSDASIAERLEAAELPPSDFVNEVASEMRRGLGLNLFNFDMIRDSRGADKYLVIDINYFPGYAKMPGYETMLTDFFHDIVQ